MHEVDYLHLAAIIAFVGSLGGGWLGMSASMCLEFDQIHELLTAIGAHFGRAHVMDCLVTLQDLLLAEHFSGRPGTQTFARYCDDCSGADMNVYFSFVCRIFGMCKWASHYTLAYK